MHTVKAHGGMKVYLHTFLNLALGNGDWVDPRTDLEPLEKRKKNYLLYLLI
jgi:hypothetical protein